MRTSTLFRSAQALGMCLCVLLFAHVAQGAVPPRIHAIRVYPDPTQPGNNPVLSAFAGQQLIANASASNVNLIYLLGWKQQWSLIVR